MIAVTVTGLERDEGSVVVLTGTDEEGAEVSFAADHRMAQAILDHLAACDEDESLDPPVAAVEEWSILPRRVSS